MYSFISERILYTEDLTPPLARGRARAKITELEAAVEGAEFFTAAHAGGCQIFCVQDPF